MIAPAWFVAVIQAVAAGRVAPPTDSDGTSGDVAAPETATAVEGESETASPDTVEDPAVEQAPAADEQDAAAQASAKEPAADAARASAPPASLANGGAVEPHPAVVGGYWDMDRAQGREPDDGREQIIVGSILLPIGTIAASTAAATVWLSAPGHCKERWAALDASPTEQQCRGTRVFGIIRVSYGSLMAVTGAVLLGIGMKRKERHRKWSRRQSFVPHFDRRGAGLTWTLRFGLGG